MARACSRRGAVWIPVLLVIATASPGCKRKEQPEGAPQGTRFALLDDGVEPRSRFRYPTSPPPPQKMALTLRLSMNMDAPGSPIPAVTMPGLRLIVELKAAKRAGGLEVRFQVSDADLIDIDGAHAGLLASMRRDVDRLTRLSGFLAIDTRGFVSDVELSAPDDLGQQSQQFVSSMRLAMTQLAVPMPAEPIGVGGKWQIEQTIDQDGIEVVQKSFYQLTGIDDSRLLIRTETVQTGDKQAAAVPGLPAGVSAEVISLSGAGRGEIEIDLLRLSPSSLREQMNTDVSFMIQQGDSERVMSLTASSALEMQAL